MRSISLPIVLILTITCAVGAFAGTYKDTAGATHAWKVDDSRSLVWEGSTYVPFGVIFAPKSFLEPSDANLKADQDDIAAFKLAGISDVLIKPEKAITSIPTETFQKIIDLMESNDLRYGIEISNPPYGQISGYIVKPVNNRVEISSTGQVSRDLPDAGTVLYVVCDAQSGEIKSYNTTTAKDGKVDVSVILKDSGKHVVLFYPHKTIAESSPDYSMPDIWGSYDSQRDSLLLYLKQLKLGKGLRFLIDPYSESFGLRGETQDLIPTSKSFRMAYSAWLSKKYSDTRKLTITWGILKHDIASFDEAVRLVPLWSNGRGAASVFDDGSGRTYGVDVTNSQLWADFYEFRSQSIVACMDLLADVIKRTIADVPVVYTATGMQSVFQPKNTVGYDGLASPASQNTTIIPDAGKVLSLAESSPKKPWMIAKLGSAGLYYEKKEHLFSAINNLHDLGAKGYFISLEGNTVSSADLMLWLGEYASISAKDTRFTSFLPRVIYYPDNITDIAPKRLSSGVWWLPSLNQGGQMNLGTLLAGYVIYDTKRGADVYVWSKSGNRTVTLISEFPITVTNDLGESTELKPKKGRVQVQLTSEPQSIRGISPDQFLPVETVNDAIKDFEIAIQRADKNMMDTVQYKRSLKAAKDMVAENQLGIALDLVRATTLELNHRLRGIELGSPKTTTTENLPTDKK